VSFYISLSYKRYKMIKPKLYMKDNYKVMYKIWVLAHADWKSNMVGAIRHS